MDELLYLLLCTTYQQRETSNMSVRQHDTSIHSSEIWQVNNRIGISVSIVQSWRLLVYVLPYFVSLFCGCSKCNMSVRQHDTSTHSSEIWQVNNRIGISVSIVQSWRLLVHVLPCFVSLFCGCSKFGVGSLLCISECERTSDVCVLQQDFWQALNFEQGDCCEIF